MPATLWFARRPPFGLNRHDASRRRTATCVARQVHLTLCTTRRTMEHVLEDLIRRYGLYAVYFGGATEGDLTLILTGALAHLGYFGFVPATALGCLGAVTIDSMWYMLGRNRAALIRSSRFYQQAGPWVEGLAQRVGAWEILFARFIFGARIPSMIFWGTHKVPFDRFVVLDIIGCFAWGF